VTLPMTDQSHENQTQLLRERISALLAQGRAHAGSSEFALALECYTQALSLSQEIDEPGLEADSLTRLGTLHYSLADYPAALSSYQQAQSRVRDRGEYSRAADAANGIGIIYFYLGDVGQALELFSEVLALRRSLDDREGLAHALNNVGGVHAEMGDHAGALRFFQECLEISQSVGNRNLESFCLGNIAQSCSALGDHSEAIAAGRAAVQAARRAHSPAHECRVLLNLGDALTKAGQIADALPHYHAALAFSESLPDPNSECAALIALGEAALMSDLLDEAQSHFCRAAKRTESLGLKQFAFQSHRGLSQVRFRQGDPAAALTHFQRYHTLEREVFGEEADRRSKGLMIQMEVDRSQREAEIHRLRNVELVQANAALEEAGKRLQAQAHLLEAQSEELRAQNDELVTQSEVLVRQAEELHRQAREDGLTGLANRRHLEGWLAAKFHDIKHNFYPLTVVMADVDHFKQINDRFGHQIGDEVLMSIGLVFRRACRVTDLAARYGGEEFVLVLPETDALAASFVCERLRQTVEGYPWQSIHPDLSVTISLGLSDDPHAASHERLLGLADAQLYAAKKAGRNRIAMATPS